MPPQTPQIAEPAAPPAAANDYPDIASDKDVIEKEWVAKVKHIVQTTKQDPFLQSQELSKLKADYLQKRYGKIVQPES